MPIEKTYRIDTSAAGLVFTLRPNRSIAIKFGLAVYAFISLAIGLGIVAVLVVSGLSFREVNGTWLFALFLIAGYAALQLLLGRSYVTKLSEVETLTVTPTQVIISLRSLFGKKDKVFSLTRVREIGIAGDENFTPHPMEDNNAAINFMINERLIRYQITDGNMYISDGKTQVRFGKEVPSWDAEEIIEKIEQYTGRTFMPRRPEEEEYWR